MAYVNLQPHEGKIVSKPVSGVKKLPAKFVSLNFFYSFGAPIATHKILQINIAVLV